MKRTATQTLFIVLALCCSSFAQGTKADYERAADLRERTRGKVFRDRVEPNWNEETGNFWYRVSTAKDKHDFVFVDVQKGTRELAFDHKRLAEAITSSSNIYATPDALPISSLRFDEDGTLFFAAGGASWKCDLTSYKLEGIEVLNAARGGSSLPSLDRIVGSGGNGEEVWVRFINRTKESVELYWVQGDGQRQKYGELKPGAEREQHTFGGHAWLATSKAGKPLAVFRAADQNRDAIIDGSVKISTGPQKSDRRKDRSERPSGISPNGEWRALVRDHNVVLVNVDSQAEFQLTEDGSEDDAYQGRMQWSPDSQKLVVMQRTAGEKRTVYMVESSPKDQLQPKLHSMDYAKPGDELPQSRPRLFDVRTKKQIPVSDELFPNPWSINHLRWQPDSRRFTFLYNQRGHQVLRIVVVDAETGEAAALVDEVSTTFIDYAYKRYDEYLDDSNEIIWMSERDGWNHLYLYDSRTGDVKNQITGGEWVVRRVERVDAGQRRIWFTASGVFPEQDPYYIHYGVVDFDGSNLTFLTRGNGTHKIEYSPDGTHFIDRYSRVDMPPVTELRRSRDGELVCELERADWTDLLATGWRAPERFVAKARDGKTDIFGVIYRPTNFDESKKYAVIEKIYAGPHGSFVPKSFSAYRRDQSYAELGFVVVQIDGMGTSNRSKAFHDICWQNLGDSGFPDRILWMQAAARRYKQLDISRVGIFGGSAGGQSTVRALLAFGEFYKVGVADCGCHDNRMDKVWWNELWMGYPIGPHYEEQSNVTQAHRLTGKLFLTVGELDRNVDPASTMQVVDALIKADKDFDFLIVPGAGHGVGESPYANRRRQDFFVRHLLGVEPRQ